jgi:hypothetical protein
VSLSNNQGEKGVSSEGSPMEKAGGKESGWNITILQQVLFKN